MRNAAWWLALTFVACSGGTPKDTTDTSSADTDTDTDADTDADTDTDTDVDTEPPDPCEGVPFTASLSGTLVDDGGSPVAGSIVNACSSFGCIPYSETEDGAFEFTDLPACAHSIDVFPPSGAGWATPLSPLMFTDGEHTDLDVILVKHGPEVTTPTTASEVEVATGLHLTVGLDNVELLFGDVSTVSGVLVDESAWPSLWEGLPATPIALWYLDPFDAESETGMPVRFDNLWKLADGQTYDVYNAVYDDFAWVHVGSVTVSGAELTGDAALKTLSPVVLVPQ